MPRTPESNAPPPKLPPTQRHVPLRHPSTTPGRSSGSMAGGTQPGHALTGTESHRPYRPPPRGVRPARSPRVLGLHSALRKGATMAIVALVLRPFTLAKGSPCLVRSNLVGASPSPGLQEPAARRPPQFCFPGDGLPSDLNRRTPPRSRFPRPGLPGDGFPRVRPPPGRQRDRGRPAARRRRTSPGHAAPPRSGVLSAPDRPIVPGPRAIRSSCTRPAPLSVSGSAGASSRCTLGPWAGLRSARHGHRLPRPDRFGPAATARRAVSSATPAPATLTNRAPVHWPPGRRHGAAATFTFVPAVLRGLVLKGGCGQRRRSQRRGGQRIGRSSGQGRRLAIGHRGGA